MLNNFFKKKESGNPHREIRELLRENLKVLEVDMFYTDDPMVNLLPEERIMYLKTFFDLYKDTKLITRIKYSINKQAQKTLENAHNGVEDMAGSMNINGMAYVMNDIERLANMYIKETAKSEEMPLDKFEIIPRVG